MTTYLSHETVSVMKQRLWAGQTQQQVADDHMISLNMVVRIVAGRAWEDVPWPDGSIGALSEVQRLTIASTRQRETFVAKKGGRKRSRKDTARLINLDLGKEPWRSEKEVWWSGHKDAEKEDGSKYTHEELEQAWLIEEQERKENKDADAKQRVEKREQLAREQQEYEKSLPQETEEEREEWEADKRRRYCLSHLWAPKGVLILENLVGAELSDEAIRDLIQADARAAAISDQLEEFIRIRRETLDKPVEGDGEMGVSK